MQKLLISLLLVSTLFIYFGCQNVPPTDPVSSMTKKVANGNAVIVPDDYATIQDAVDAIGDKGTIHVKAGVYSEAVTIDGKDISLLAIGDVTIAPLAPTAHGDAISIYNGAVTIDGFKIDATECNGGIYAGGGFPINDFPVSVSVENCKVYYYYKNGITVNGAKAYGSIIANTVLGSGPLGVGNAAQNGIQFGYGGTGKARNNYVEGNLYTGPDWGATGILIFESSNVICQDNEVKGCGTGVGIQTWGWYLPDASNNNIDRNTVEDCEWGISVAAYDLGYGYSQMDAFAVNNKVVNNTITVETITDAQVGIEIWAGTAWGGNGTTPTASNNKVINNTIVGYSTAVDEDGTVKSKIHANAYE